jgi:outer membrane immunogenic protein
MNQRRTTAFAIACLATTLPPGIAPGIATAHAADLARPLRSDPIDETAGYGKLYNWQGLYLGGSAGYGWGTSTHNYDRNANHGTAETELTGGLASLTIGYNWYAAPSVVLGIEGDLGVIDVSANDKEIFDGHVWKSQIGPFWGTLRARAGYLVTPALLLYGTGGIAFAEFDEIAVGDAAGQSAKNQDFKVGWTLGAGAEWAFSHNLTAKVEYLHMDFGQYDGLSENRETFYFDNTVDVVRLGVNWKM